MNERVNVTYTHVIKLKKLYIKKPWRNLVRVAVEGSTCYWNDRETKLINTFKFLILITWFCYCVRDFSSRARTFTISVVPLYYLQKKQFKERCILLELLFHDWAQPLFCDCGISGICIANQYFNVWSLKLSMSGCENRMVYVVLNSVFVNL